MARRREPRRSGVGARRLRSSSGSPGVLLPRARAFLSVQIRPRQPEGRRRRPTRATRRRAISGRPPLHGRGPPILSRREPLLFGGRHGLLVWRGVPRPPHRQWRGLRHGVAVGRASDDAVAKLCARDQSRERLFGDRARQRSRPLPWRPGDGRVVACRRCPRHEGDGHGQSGYPTGLVLRNADVAMSRAKEACGDLGTGICRAYARRRGSGRSTRS